MLNKLTGLVFRKSQKGYRKIANIEMFSFNFFFCYSVSSVTVTTPAPSPSPKKIQPPTDPCISVYSEKCSWDFNVQNLLPTRSRKIIFKNHQDSLVNCICLWIYIYMSPHPYNSIHPHPSRLYTLQKII